MTRSRPEKIAIVGAGRMGRGLAHVFAYAGFPVTLVDLKQRDVGAAARTLANAAAEIDRTITLMQTFGQIDAAQRQEILSRIAYADRTGSGSALAAADLIMEGVPETLPAKQAALSEIAAAAGSQSIIASTTSTMLVDELAQFVAAPGRFLNAHWLNPAYLVPLVEVSPGKQTAPSVTKTTQTILRAAGKVPIVCAPSPGYIVPRIQALAMNEAARMADEGVASPADLDQAIRVGFGIRFAILGMIEFIDWGGGDILYYASRYLQQAIDEDRFAAPAIIDRNMEAGKTGMHAGQGFYDYSEIDVAAYQQQTLAKFVDLIQHLGLMPPPYGAERPEA